MTKQQKRRIGIVGYGKLGAFLADKISHNTQSLELAFVWNRDKKAIDGKFSEQIRLRELKNFRDKKPDLIVEVAHPIITQKWGQDFLSYCDYMVGSPTAFANLDTENQMRALAVKPNGNGLYIPRGALPGLEEVLRMKSAGKLKQSTITMKKHPSSLKYSGPLTTPLAETKSQRVVYSGPLRDLCHFAPNNVNTMAVLAMASEIGFDGITATLIADPTLQHHITEVVLYGPNSGGPRYSLSLVRNSPAGVGAVTSTATLTTFLNSMITARDRGNGVHFC